MLLDAEFLQGISITSHLSFSVHITATIYLALLPVVRYRQIERSHTSHWLGYRSASFPNVLLNRESNEVHFGQLAVPN